MVLVGGRRAKKLVGKAIELIESGCVMEEEAMELARSGALYWHRVNGQSSRQRRRNPAQGSRRRDRGNEGGAAEAEAIRAQAPIELQP